MAICLRHCTRDESIRCLLLQIVSCVPCLETRVGLKFYTILIEDRMSEHMHGVNPNVSDITSENERINLFINLVGNEI